MGSVRLDNCAAKNIGTGNLYRVIKHGQDMGVVSGKEVKRPGESKWAYGIPSKPPVPGKAIYDDAIAKFEADNPHGKMYGDRDSEGWKRADETARALGCGGLDDFADDLAANLGMNLDEGVQEPKLSALKAISEQLFSTKAAAWWAAFKAGQSAEAPGGKEAVEVADDNLIGDVSDLDARLGRDFSKDDLMASAVTLAKMVEIGELDIAHVGTYLDETVFDYSDQKATLQMTARAMGEMRANVIRKGWGNEYSTLVSQYADQKIWRIKESEKTGEEKELERLYNEMVAAADRIREKRMKLVDDLGLGAIPTQEGDGERVTLRKIQSQLATGSKRPTKKSASGLGFSNKDCYAKDEVNAFRAAARNFKAKLDAYKNPDAPEANVQAEAKAEQPNAQDEDDFSADFKKNTIAYLKTLSQGAGLSARLAEEEEIRASFKEALGGIPRDKDGLCKAGTYALSVSLGVNLFWGTDGSLTTVMSPADTPEASLSLKPSYTFTTTVTINEDGSASASKIHGGKVEVTGKAALPGVSIAVGGEAGGSRTDVTRYPDIESLCDGSSRAILALMSGKAHKSFFRNLFHFGTTNSKSREMAQRIDNYAMRSLLGKGETNLMGETDQYLTPMKYNPVTGKTVIRSLDSGVKVDFSAGMDDLKKGGTADRYGIMGGIAANVSGVKTTDIGYRRFFDLARDGELKIGEDDSNRYEDSLRKAPGDGDVEKLVARLAQLRKELDGFARIAAVQKGMSERQFALQEDPGDVAQRYGQYLENRHYGDKISKLGVFSRFFSFFRRNVRRTIFLGDLAREAAYCEQKLRSLDTHDRRLLKQAERSIEAIERGVYDNPDVHLNETYAKECLFQTEKSTSYSRVTNIGVNYEMKIPEGTAIFPAGTVKKPSIMGSVKITTPTGVPDKLADRPKRPWDPTKSLDVTIDLSTVAYVGPVLTELLNDKIDTELSVKGLTEEAAREAVFRLVNEAIVEAAKKRAKALEESGSPEAALLTKKLVPIGDVFSGKESHAITFRFARTSNGWHYKEVSVDRKHSQSVGLDVTVHPGVALNFSASRSSSRNLRYRVGTDTLGGVMSHYGNLGTKTVKWNEFLYQQGSRIVSLARNAGGPAFEETEDDPPELIVDKPRSGVKGELDMIQEQMWKHGNREQYEAFMDAWRNVKDAVDSSSRNNDPVAAKKICGDAMTRLLATISDFYRETNQWWQEGTMEAKQDGFDSNEQSQEMPFDMNRGMDMTNSEIRVSESLMSNSIAGNQELDQDSP